MIKIICAWCGKLMDKDKDRGIGNDTNVNTNINADQAAMDDVGIVSHGICKKCFNVVMEELEDLK